MRGIHSDAICDRAREAREFTRRLLQFNPSRRGGSEEIIRVPERVVSILLRRKMSIK